MTREEKAKKWVEDNKYGIDEYCLSAEDFGEHGYLSGSEEFEQENNHLREQLTKAKGHIENLLYYVKQCTCEKCNYAEIEKDIHKFSFSLIKEAEQFLKEG